MFIVKPKFGPAKAVFVLRLILASVALFFVFTSASTAQNRQLWLYFTHTKEELKIVYKKNGRFVPSALKRLNRFLRDWRENESAKIDPMLFDVLWDVYAKSGSRNAIHIYSAYRAPKTNQKLRQKSRNVARNSQHTKGKAIDFYLPDVSSKRLRDIGMKLQAGGVGHYSGRFVHLDTASVRHWPRLNRKTLTGLFPKGQTLHVPTDRRPLAGYPVALARYKSTGRGSPTAAPRQFASAAAPSQSRKNAFTGGRNDEFGSFVVASTRQTQTESDAPSPASPPASLPKPEEAVRESIIKTAELKEASIDIIPRQKPVAPIVVAALPPESVETPPEPAAETEIASPQEDSSAENEQPPETVTEKEEPRFDPRPLTIADLLALEEAELDDTEPFLENEVVQLAAEQNQNATETTVWDIIDKSFQVAGVSSRQLPTALVAYTNLSDGAEADSLANRLARKVQKYRQKAADKQKSNIARSQKRRDDQVPKLEWPRRQFGSQLLFAAHGPFSAQFSLLQHPDQRLEPDLFRAPQKVIVGTFRRAGLSRAALSQPARIETIRLSSGN